MSLTEKFKKLLSFIVSAALCILFIPVLLIFLALMLVILLFAMGYNIVIAIVGVFTKKDLPFIDFETKEDKKDEETREPIEDRDK